jgi:hypothetical protein
MVYLKVRSSGQYGWSAVESYAWSPSNDQCGTLRPFGNHQRTGASWQDDRRSEFSRAAPSDGTRPSMALACRQSPTDPKGCRTVTEWVVRTAFGGGIRRVEPPGMRHRADVTHCTRCYPVIVAGAAMRCLASRVGTTPNANLLSGQGGAPAREDVANRQLNGAC